MKKIKVGDKVRVIAGKFKGKEGMIQKIDRNSLNVHVENINRIKHKKPSQNEKGEIKKIPSSIHISNVMLLDPKGVVTTRVGFKIVKDKKIRFSKKTKKEYKN